ncbi:acyltransferase family protein [Geodermatophilus saharensis]|uniref:acyltransferase family protein n=1 Tax=Geodermatophilus saharensis TaxID=1137994 RepID=UPI0011404B21|nr:acyltransferase [Geodermatophilus saharensis]
MSHGGSAPSAGLPASPPVVLPRLTGMRAFAALAVFLFHLDVWGVVRLPGGVSRAGFVGVGFFFVLSGFVLAWGTRPDLPTLRFYRRRFARVWPSHAVVLAVAAVLPVVAVHRDVPSGVANALLVQAWSPDPEVVYSFNGVSWSLSCEAFFYLVFPVAALVVRRLPRRVAGGLAVLGLLLALLAGLLRPELAFHLPLVRVGEFLVGLVAGVAVRDGWRPRPRGAVVVPVVLAALAAVLVVPPPVADVVAAVPFLLVVLHAARRDLDGRRGWLTSRTVVFAGEASFAFYLVHELTVLNLRDLVPGPVAGRVAVIVVVATTAAVVLHLAVERPCNRWLRDRAPSVALASPPLLDDTAAETSRTRRD